MFAGNVGAGIISPGAGAGIRLGERQDLPPKVGIGPRQGFSVALFDVGGSTTPGHSVLARSVYPASPGARRVIWKVPRYEKLRAHPRLQVGAHGGDSAVSVREEHEDFEGVPEVVV